MHRLHRPAAPLVPTCLALALAACAPAAPEPAPLQGVVLVLLDTVRADRLGCYGHERPTSPHIDALAAEGVRFEQAISSAPWTLPSVASLLAGEYPERVLAARLQRSLVSDLAAGGVTTAAFTEGAFVSRAFGFDRGFDSWTESEGPVQLIGDGESRRETTGGGARATFAAAADWLDQVGERPFFLLVHTYEAHTPYTDGRFTAGGDAGRIGPSFEMEELDQVIRGELVLADAETDHLAALYDGDIAATDEALGAFLERLAASGLDRRTAVVVTSDHGEELGRHYPHNTADHGHALLDSLMRVPLVVRDPSRPRRSPTVAAQVRLVDVMPTVAELLAVRLSDHPRDGRSLLPLMHGGADADRPALLGQPKSGPLRIGLRHRGHKFVLGVDTPGERPVVVPEPPARQLYDLGVDPHELVNLVEQRPDLAAELERILTEVHPGRDRALAPLDDSALDEQLVQRLRSLGYLR